MMAVAALLVRPMAMDGAWGAITKRLCSRSWQYLLFFLALALTRLKISVRNNSSTITYGKPREIQRYFIHACNVILALTMTLSDICLIFCSQKILSQKQAFASASLLIEPRLPQERGVTLYFGRSTTDESTLLSASFQLWKWPKKQLHPMVSWKGVLPRNNISTIQLLCQFHFQKVVFTYFKSSEPV